MLKKGFYQVLGKSDNTREDVSVGSILRIASEDINKYSTNISNFPYYKGYVSVVIGPVPEKDVPDRIEVLERLSKLTPRRESFVKDSITDEVKISIANGKIPKEIYEKYAVKEHPLPKEFYVEYREGTAFAQTHLRGLEDEEVKKYKQGKIGLAELFKGHSIHVDLRIDFGVKRGGKNFLIQWVFTDNDVESYFKMLKGELVETASGVKNVAKSFAIVKPSAEEPSVLKAEEKEPSINTEGARMLEKYQIKEGSYFIQPGEVGSTMYTTAWMGLIWKGKVRSGIQRDDYHEYFLYPDSKLPSENKKLLDGQFVVKAFKRTGGAGNYWQVWKATEGLPSDPIEHCDIGHFLPIPAKELGGKIGREHYIEESKELYRGKSK